MVEHKIILATEPTSIGRRSNSNKDRKFVSIGEPVFSYLIKDNFLNESVIKTFEKGDTLNLLINKYDYDVKIKRTQEPKWIDKHLSWPVIRIYGITENGNQLVSPDATL